MFLYLLFSLYFVSCPQKIRWREHSLADTVPLFLNISQFSSEMSKNWGNRLPCLRPLWIYCTGQQPKDSDFPVRFPVFPPFLYNCSVTDPNYHSHKTCWSILAPLGHHSSGMLTSPNVCHFVAGQSMFYVKKDWITMCAAINNPASSLTQKILCRIVAILLSADAATRLCARRALYRWYLKS
jgi:hypothetical protein